MFEIFYFSFNCSRCWLFHSYYDVNFVEQVKVGGLEDCEVNYTNLEEQRLSWLKFRDRMEFMVSKSESH